MCRLPPTYSFNESFNALVCLSWRDLCLKCLPLPPRWLTSPFDSLIMPSYTNLDHPPLTDIPDIFGEDLIDILPTCHRMILAALKYERSTMNSLCADSWDLRHRCCRVDVEWGAAFRVPDPCCVWGLFNNHCWRKDGRRSEIKNHVKNVIVVVYYIPGALSDLRETSRNGFGISV